MTARTPLESMEDPTDESSETTSSRGEGSSNDDHASNGTNGSSVERGEASLSRTLEAILSKTDDDEVPLGREITGTETGTPGSTKALGSHTLLGLGGVKLPGVTPVEVEAAGPSISVDTMFDDPDDDLVGRAMAPPVGPPGLDGEVEPGQIEREEEAGGRVGDLLDEVAQALNVQAAETRDRAIGRVPSPGANAPGARGAMKTPLVRTAEEFEFEDPDDGPTTLNAGEGKLEAAASADDDDDDEESVVLGPGNRSEGKREARLTGSHPGANLAGASARNTLPIPAVPMPGSPGSGRPTRATPFAGLPAATLPTFPAPGSGRTRLPTPAPGTALGITGPATAGRSVLPPGAPGREDSAGPIPLAGLDAPAGRRSSGRISAASATLSGADASGRNGAVAEPHPSAFSSARLVLEQTLLKKDLKFRAISFGAIVLGVFVGGLFIGHAVIKGSPEATAAAPPSASPAPAVAAAKPVDPTGVAAPAASTAPAATAPAPSTKTAAVGDAAKAAAPAPAPTPTVVPAGSVAEAATPGTAQMQFDEQPLRKRRPHRAATPAPKDDLDLAPASKRVAAVTPPPVSKAPTAGKSGPKKKSTWHDPFAD